MTLSYRLAPIPQSYLSMKLDLLNIWAERDYAGYMSPWVPVSEGNRGLIEKGTLIIDEKGIEAPYKIGRDLQVIKEGRLVNILPSDSYISRQPRFQWVDTQNEDVERYLKGNPDAENYREYSKLMEEALKGGHLTVEKVQFPLFHETSLDAARNILANGINVLLSMLPSVNIYGAAFYLGLDFEDVKGRGTHKGAVVKFDCWDGESPLWLKRAKKEWGDLHRFFQKVSGYNFRNTCSELAASALLSGVTVLLYEYVEQFSPVEIIETG